MCRVVVISPTPRRQTLALTHDCMHTYAHTHTIACQYTKEQIKGWEKRFLGLLQYSGQVCTCGWVGGFVRGWCFGRTNLQIKSPLILTPSQVTPELYTRYYLELRDLYENVHEGTSFPLTQMSDEHVGTVCVLGGAGGGVGPGRVSMSVKGFLSL